MVAGARSIREKKRKRKRRSRLFLENGGASEESIPKSVDVKGFSYTPVHDVEVDVLQEEQCRGNHRYPLLLAPWEERPSDFSGLPLPFKHLLSNAMQYLPSKAA